MKIEIKDHLLYIDDKQVAFRKTPNISAYKNKLQYLIEHYTATYSSSSPISWLTNKDSQVSAHLVIDKQGVVTQLAPFDAVCWHAGTSIWKGISGLNQYSIGIEIVNSGILSPKNGKYYSVDGSEVTSFSRLRNKLGLIAVWENYPEKQIEVVAEVSKALQKYYSLKEILGHEDISPGRKTDPGPAFPWDKIKSVESYVAKSATANLNLRQEANPLGKVIKVIPKGTIVKVLKQEGEWTFTGDGWVSTKYLK